MKRIPASGYARDLAPGLVAYAHPDGSLSLERADGSALDFDPAQVAALADLLRLSAGQRSNAARRRSKAAYLARFDGEVIP